MSTTSPAMKKAAEKAVKETPIRKSPKAKQPVSSTGIDVLKIPLNGHEVEWRISNAKNGKTQVVPYIQNRCVMDRFDKAFGWDGWENSLREISGGFICRILVTLPDGKTVIKEDGAPQTSIESVKGGISDSMKRCAVQFGLGRELYEYPKIYLEGEHKWIPNWAEDRLFKMVQYYKDYPEKRTEKDVIIIKNNKTNG